MDKSICRIGVFYDGSYFTYAQNHFYADRKLGWLTFQPFHSMIENFIREKEQGYSNYRVVFEYEVGSNKSYANERLLNACNYTLNVNELERERKSQGTFRGLFRQPEKGASREPSLPDQA